MPTTEQLLDYYIVLALSNDAYYRDFDQKSVEFVESGLSLLEKRFTGSESITVKVEKDPVTKEEEEVKLTYFRSIPSNSKVYNKVLVQQLGAV